MPEPIRPRAALCVSLETGLLTIGDVEIGDARPLELARGTLRAAARSWGVSPGVVEVGDPALVSGLQPQLGQVGARVALRQGLPAIDEVVLELARAQPAGKVPDILRGKGVTIERVAAFARAAERFFAAAPWRFLSAEDLLEVDCPASTGLRWFSVMGSGGQEFGILFYPGRGSWEKLMTGRTSDLEKGSWAVSFDLPWEVPPADLVLWERHGLPLAGGAYLPMPVRRSGRKIERADAARLAFFEALLTALATTSEEEIDAGVWEKEVETSRGMLQLRLRLPMLAELEASATEDRESGGEPANARERAERLVSFAWPAVGRTQMRAARKALELWPDCVDAHVILGNGAADPESAREHYARAVAAGECELGLQLFREEAGHFWALHETRPYMNARLLLAEALDKLGRTEEAREHCEELLRLNPNDNQGVRYLLAELLLKLERHDQLAEMLAGYGDDRFAAFSYVRALLAFRREGDSTEALRLLRDAVRANRFVPTYLLGKRPLPAEPPDFYSPGREDEAAEYARHGKATWTMTPGALEWLTRRTSKKSRARTAIPEEQP